MERDTVVCQPFDDVVAAGYETPVQITYPFFFQLTVIETVFAYPFCERKHARAQFSLRRFLLIHGEKRIVQTVWRHLDGEISRGAALAYVRREFRGDDSVALRIPCFHCLAFRRQSAASDAVAVRAQDHLHCICHTAFVCSTGRMKVVDAGQNVFQRERVMHDTVRSVFERQRQS